MPDPAQNDAIDLSASEARVRSARALAAAQARQVAVACDGADDQSIDLLFLLQENVLVMSETHVMLERLAGMDEQKKELASQEPMPAHFSFADWYSRPGRRAISSAVTLGLAIVTSACILEILDPAPMEVEATIVHFLRPAR